MKTDKQAVRQAVNKLRLELTPMQNKALSLQVCQHLSTHPHIKDSKTIALYFATPHEVDVLPLTHLLPNTTQYLLPVLLPNRHLKFFPYKPGDKTRQNKYGIAEPLQWGSAPCAQDIDAIIIPLVGFDEHCARVGTGGGYYDRTLAFLSQNASKTPHLLGAAFEFQKVNSITTDPWDIPLHGVATEKKIYLATTP